MFIVPNFAADSELMNFLKQEIQHERDAASKVSPSTLFEVRQH